MVEEESTRGRNEEEQRERKQKINAIWEQLNSRESAVIASRAKNVIKAAARGESRTHKDANMEEFGDKSKMNKVVKQSPKLPVSDQEWMSRLGISAKKQSGYAKPPAGIDNRGEGNAESNMPFDIGQVMTSNEDKGTSDQMSASALAAAKAVAAITKDEKPIGANIGEQHSPRFMDPSSETSKRKAQMQAAASSGLDALLEQIGKKQKVNILDKSRKDWGEFKEEKGLEEELEAYKKSGDKYLDKLSFLQRADLREYEKERDARLAFQAKRRLETATDTDT